MTRPLAFCCQVSAPTANGPRTYRYDHIFGGDRGQPSGQLFHTCVEPLVEGLFQGYNATVSKAVLL